MFSLGSLVSDNTVLPVHFQVLILKHQVLQHLQIVFFFPLCNVSYMCNQTFYYWNLTAWFFLPSFLLGRSEVSACGTPLGSAENMNPMELEMRMKLAELQRKYKEKKKELDKLQKKKDKRWVCCDLSEEKSCCLFGFLYSFAELHIHVHAHTAYKVYKFKYILIMVHSCLQIQN